MACTRRAAPRERLGDDRSHAAEAGRDTRGDIEKLCREAAEFHFATVCVNPAWVATAAALLRGSGVGVCSVVGFPLGATTADVKNYETRRAIFDGATEIDMVINIGALKSGDLRTVERDIEAVVEPCRQCGAVSKVIIEAALLTDEEKVTACTLAKAAGADFVKTSTGFASGGATAADVALMRRVVGADMGVKAAGGVRDLEGLKAMVAAGATRVGASAGVKIVQESKGQKPVRAAGIRLLSVRDARLDGRAVAGTGKGMAKPLLAKALTMRRRSSRPTTHCFSGTVLIRAFIFTDHSPNASTPSTSIGSRIDGPNTGSACSDAPTSRMTAATRSVSS